MAAHQASTNMLSSYFHLFSQPFTENKRIYRHSPLFFFKTVETPPVVNHINIQVLEAYFNKLANTIPVVDRNHYHAKLVYFQPYFILKIDYNCYTWLLDWNWISSNNSTWYRVQDQSCPSLMQHNWGLKSSPKHMTEKESFFKAQMHYHITSGTKTEHKLT